jgi:hypothetical protein
MALFGGLGSRNQKRSFFKRYHRKDPKQNLAGPIPINVEVPFYACKSNQITLVR